MAKKYFVNYNTGAGNFIMTSDLEEVIKETIEGIGYTQKDVTIMGEYYNVVALLPWINRSATEDDIITADYGEFGFYGKWIIYEEV